MRIDEEIDPKTYVIEGRRTLRHNTGLSRVLRYIRPEIVARLSGLSTFMIWVSRRKPKLIDEITFTVSIWFGNIEKVEITEFPGNVRMEVVYRPDAAELAWRARRAKKAAASRI